MGAPGIALANTIAFTIQALVMIWLLNRKFPGIAQVRSTLWRVPVGSHWWRGAGVSWVEYPAPGQYVADDQYHCNQPAYWELLFC